MDKVIQVGCGVSFLASWLWASYSIWGPSRAPLSGPIALVLLGILVAVLLRMAGRNIKLPGFIRFLGAFVLCWWMLVQWAYSGALLVVQPNWPPHLPQEAFLWCPLVQALAVSLTFAYPLLVICPRRLWLVTWVAAMVVKAIEFRVGVPSTPGTWLLRIWDFACLAVLVPLVVRFLDPRLKLGRVEGAEDDSVGPVANRP
jgi:hypothetical protein